VSEDGEEGQRLDALDIAQYERRGRRKTRKSSRIILGAKPEGTLIGERGKPSTVKKLE